MASDQDLVCVIVLKSVRSLASVLKLEIKKLGWEKSILQKSVVSVKDLR